MTRGTQRALHDRMSDSSRTTFALVALLGLAGCTPRVYSPPARALPMEAPASIGDGQTALQLEGGMSGMTFGPSLLHGTARVRHGLSEELEMSGEANIVGVVIGDDDYEETDAHRGIYSARFGLKRSFSRHFALRFGLGSGGSAGGGFVSPDVGLVVGFDNPVVVPFGGVSVFTSVPLGAREVSFVNGSGDELALSPYTTLGVGWNAGLRVPFGEALDLDHRRMALVFGAGGTWLRTFHGEGDKDLTVGFTFGLEIVL